MPSSSLYLQRGCHYLSLPVCPVGGQGPPWVCCVCQVLSGWQPIRWMGGGLPLALNRGWPGLSLWGRASSVLSGLGTRPPLPQTALLPAPWVDEEPWRWKGCPHSPSWKGRGQAGGEGRSRGPLNETSPLASPPLAGSSWSRVKPSVKMPWRPRRCWRQTWRTCTASWRAWPAARAWYLCLRGRGRRGHRGGAGARPVLNEEVQTSLIDPLSARHLESTGSFLRAECDPAIGVRVRVSCVKGGKAPPVNPGCSALGDASSPSLSFAQHWNRKWERSYLLWAHTMPATPRHLW